MDGIFLSEHTTSLDDDKRKVDMQTDLTRTDKLVLIGQLYASQLKGHFVVKEKKNKKTHVEHVSELSPVEITIKTEQGYQLLQIDDILSISLMEENDYE